MVFLSLLFALCLFLLSVFCTLGTANIRPLNPKSDQHLVSPNNDIAESFIQDHKNKGNDQQLKRLLIVTQFLFVSTLGNA